MLELKNQSQRNWLVNATIFMMTISIFVMFCLTKYYGAASGFIWEPLKWYTAFAVAAVVLHIWQRNSELAWWIPAGSVLGLLLTPAGYVVEVIRDRDLFVASKFFLYVGPSMATGIAFLASIAVVLFERRSTK